MSEVSFSNDRSRCLVRGIQRPQPNFMITTRGWYNYNKIKMTNILIEVSQLIVS